MKLRPPSATLRRSWFTPAIVIAAILSLNPLAAIAWTVSNTEQNQIDILQPVSIVRVIANPDEYNGRRVRLAGYLITSFEQSAVFLDRESYDQGIYANAIWLQVPPQMTNSERKHLSGQYVSVQGTFLADFKGHVNAFSGELGSIEQIDVIPSENAFKRGLIYQYWITTWPKTVLILLSILVIFGFSVWILKNRRSDKK